MSHNPTSTASQCNQISPEPLRILDGIMTSSHQAEWPQHFVLYCVKSTGHSLQQRIVTVGKKGG